MRHRHHKVHTDHTKPELPITPMLDMSFQLLAFFIITFKPATTEGQLSLQLPKAGDETTLAAPDPNKLSEDPAELYVVRVQADSSGNIAGLELLVPKVVEPMKFETDTSKLLVEMKSRVEGKKSTGEAIPRLEYQFADKLNYQFVMKQLDEARQAGFEKVSPTLLVLDKPKPMPK
jgi:biopolymer transport protein ExbD